ncbi:Uncharacterised protein [Staphylococcus piscifermentans]|uniref:Uncharacterized protein n=2 Tax=Staphylococcus piscifermentans TaxID=70258 RepID=A0A239U6J6_9STAP|nr:hypothetical protein [Staphylococcus piscifermentans]RTX85906.1 hypothetical protein CD139_02635 [Staphylococcus piscifermentans]GEP83574.1 hypothetical protein SPI02_01590 [Staphylococcus piscifermentans]SNV05058.1 Uncharacterised protein [Staphylococcus piscifermentans]
MVLTYRTLLFVLSLMMPVCFEASKALGHVFFYSTLAVYLTAASFILYKIGKVKRNKRLRKQQKRGRYGLFFYPICLAPKCDNTI